jgi:hypothetical protein
MYTFNMPHASDNNFLAIPPVSGTMCCPSDILIDPILAVRFLVDEVLRIRKPSFRRSVGFGQGRTAPGGKMC